MVCLYQFVEGWTEGRGMRWRYDLGLHHRRSIRLRGYNYGLPGASSVTMCVQDRMCLFGEIVEGEVRLTLAGQRSNHGGG